MKKTICIVLVLIMLLCVCACGNQSASAPAPVDSVPSPDGIVQVQEGQDATAQNENAAITEKPDGIQPGTVFTFASTKDYPLYCPWIDNRAQDFLFQLYDNLLQRHMGNANDVRPALAESYTISDDGLTYVFTLRQDAFFSDGEQVNADAFVYTWKNATEEYQPRYFEMIDSYEATSEFELTIKLKYPCANFLTTTCAEPQQGPVSPKALEQYGKEDNRSAVGCGPYIVESYTPGEGFVLKANTNYYNELKQPSIETINFSVIPDLNTQIVAFESGQIDCLVFTSCDTYQLLKDHGFNVLAVPDRTQPMWLNARQVECFRDIRVREAIAHMIDWNEVNALAFNGLFHIPDSYIEGPGGYPDDDGAYDYDPELGRKLIEEAGYKLEDIKFTLLADPDMTVYCVVIAQMLNDNGLVNVDTQTLDGMTCYGMLKGGTYDAFIQCNGYSLVDCLTGYKMGLPLGCTQPVCWLYYENMDAYNEAMEWYQKALTSTNYDDYTANTAQITRIAQENYAAVGSYTGYRFWAIQDKFSGAYPTVGLSYMDFAYLYNNEG